ncbi:MAG: hypothetical protein K2X93_25070 [Candidatus Obscuribacterales bacterium]|nr:hypothetical protein [Candidatus Obscuribacterales bacterium]
MNTANINASCFHSRYEVQARSLIFENRLWQAFSTVSEKALSEPVLQSITAIGMVMIKAKNHLV